jgi:hypothetical protein
MPASGPEDAACHIPLLLLLLLLPAHVCTCRVPCAGLWALLMWLLSWT